MLRDERKKALKQQIFLKSIELFKEYGYENVTVEKIASESGIAKGTFFNYFPKKEHVLLHLGNSQNELLKDLVQKHQDPSIKKRLQLIFQDILSVYVEGSDILKLSISETIRSALTEESTNIDEFKKILTDVLNEAKQDKSLHSPFDSYTISTVLVGIYFNTLISWSMNTKEREDIVAIFHGQFDVVWQGIESQRS
ncbi:TetR/AcrR family transcriptional regulator [Salipaludibacillus sp. HK11]|uniref:TetR/AcrR family transcriptional regulator n=1 Tax=Salipaludibacillus sp. HK11 TaxID=3394320 RepID=UPI0039FBBE1A